MTSRTFAYEFVDCALRTWSVDAVLIAVGDGVPREFWIPRTCLHPEDAADLHGLAPGIQLKLRVLKWKADKLGLGAIPADAGSQIDLFGG